MHRNYAAIDEILPVFMNARKPRDMDNIFGKLEENNCLDYIVLMEYSTHFRKFGRLKDNNLTKLQMKDTLWSLQYLASKVKVESDASDGQDRSRKHKFVMNKIVAGQHHFSPLFHDVLRYDTTNYFIIKNSLLYFEELLGVSTHRYTIQRLLSEIYSLDTNIDKMYLVKITKIYELFEVHPNFILYLDAFYHTLSLERQKIALKIVIVKRLEESAAKSRWVMNSMSNGALSQRKKSCDGYKCISKLCAHCILISGIDFKDLFAALRFAKAPANKHAQASILKRQPQQEQRVPVKKRRVDQ